MWHGFISGAKYLCGAKRRRHYYSSTNLKIIENEKNVCPTCKRLGIVEIIRNRSERGKYISEIKLP